MTTTDPTTDRGYCPGCGYDLRGSPGERCPECGLAVDAAHLQLAWERRRDLGRVRAFVRTAWLATRHPGRLARVVGRRVDATSAGRFRAVVLAIVVVAASAAFAVVVHHQGGTGFLSAVDDRAAPAVAPTVFTLGLLWSAGATIAPVLPIGLLVCLAIGTRWDHWFVLGELTKAQRHRVMAVARYTVAPLLGTVVVAALATVLICVLDANADPVEWPQLVALTGWAISVTGGAVALLTWTGPARYALALPGGGAARAALVLAGTAVQWAVAVVLGLGALPAAVGFIWVMIDSLR